MFWYSKVSIPLYIFKSPDSPHEYTWWYTTHYEYIWTAINTLGIIKGPLTQKMFPFHDVIMTTVVRWPHEILMSHSMTLLQIAVNYMQLSALRPYVTYCGLVTP